MYCQNTWRSLPKRYTHAQTELQLSERWTGFYSPYAKIWVWLRWKSVSPMENYDPFNFFRVFLLLLLLFFYAAASHRHSKLGQHRSRPQSLIVSGLIFILFSTMRHQFPMSLFVSFLPFHHHSFSYFTFIDKSVFFPFFRGREKTQGWHKR